MSEQPLMHLPVFSLSPRALSCLRRLARARVYRIYRKIQKGVPYFPTVHKFAVQFRVRLSGVLRAVGTLKIRELNDCDRCPRSPFTAASVNMSAGSVDSSVTALVSAAGVGLGGLCDWDPGARPVQIIIVAAASIATIAARSRAFQNPCQFNMTALRADVVVSSGCRCSAILDLFESSASHVSVAAILYLNGGKRC
jgi:hypothetical protein